MIRFSRNDSFVKRDVMSPVGDLISHLKSIFIYLFLVTFSNQLSTAVLPKPVLEPPPCTAPFVCLPLTHLIPLTSSLVETARTKLGVSD